MVPVRSIGFHDLPQNVLQGLVCTFRQSVPLRILNRSPTMDHCIVLGESSSYFIDKVCPLVAHQLNLASVSTPYILVQKFSGGSGRIVLQRFCFHPLGAIIRCYEYVPITCLGRSRFKWADKVKVPLLEWLER
jgi:hypothetical protein